MSEKIIYTALFGEYEELKEPLVATPGWRYICITDQHIQSKVWNIVKVHCDQYPPQLVARTEKITQYNMHGCGDQSIWIDASFQINCNLDEFWNKYFKAPITAIRHPVRTCAYKEADVCIKRGLDADNVRRQIKGYAKEGLPFNSGLVSSGILLRDNSEQTKQFCDLWWQQIVNGSVRDQLGFAYAAWKMPIINYVDYDYRVRQEFIYSKHFHKR